MEKCAFADIHIFPYSKREGTVAYKFGEIDGKVVSDRVKRLESTREKLRKNYREKFIGQQSRVLIEEKDGEFFVGYSERYLKIYTKNECKIGEIINLTPQELYNDGLKD